MSYLDKHNNAKKLIDSLIEIYDAVFIIDIENESFEALKYLPFLEKNATGGTSLKYFYESTSNLAATEKEKDDFNKSFNLDYLTTSFLSGKKSVTREYLGVLDSSWAEISAKPLLNEENRFTHILFTIKNSNKTKTYEILSNYDICTDVFNRNKFINFMDMFDSENVSNVCITYIDVNGLHNINEMHGHHFGDRVLKSITKTFKQHMTDSTIYRIGGDEFVVFSENQEYESVKKEINLARGLLEDRQIYVSIGIVWSDTNFNLNELLKAADRKMYSDKCKYYEKIGGKPR